MAKQRYFRVIYSAGAFIDNFHYSENEIVPYNPKEGEDLKWGVETDADGNDLEPNDADHKIANRPDQKIANSVGSGTGAKGAQTDEQQKEAQRAKEIKEATTLLDGANDEHWTQSGEARMEALESVLGYQITHKELDAAVPDFKRPAKA